MDGQEIDIPTYIPDGGLLTRAKREQADLLDEIIQEKIKEVNDEYKKLPQKIKKTAILKWRWLGEKIDNIIDSVDEIKERYVNTHIIWPAIGQHLTDELQSGLNTKRSATHKDHYRKCWLLYRTIGVDWIKNWVGWDAFVDRGDELITSEKVMPKINNYFHGMNLDSDDYQWIAKKVTNELPLSGKSAINLNEMSDEEIDRRIKMVYDKFKEQ